jgi:hypothetical protein
VYISDLLFERAFTDSNTFSPAIVTMAIENYLMTTDDACYALHNLASTHTVNLMQARDVDGNLIMLADYACALRDVLTIG